MPQPVSSVLNQFVQAPWQGTAEILHLKSCIGILTNVTQPLTILLTCLLPWLAWQGELKLKVEIEKTVRLGTPSWATSLVMRD